MNTLDSSDLSTFIRETALKTGLLLPIIEKDYWVVWLLELLFSGPYAGQLTFKGGTSLSKAYKVIDRFSEDVDLTINRGLIDLNQEKSLEEPGLDRAQPMKRKKAFDSSVQDFIRDEFALWLNAALKARASFLDSYFCQLIFFDQ